MHLSYLQAVSKVRIILNWMIILRMNLMMADKNTLIFDFEEVVENGVDDYG